MKSTHNYGWLLATLISISAVAPQMVSAQESIAPPPTAIDLKQEVHADISNFAKVSNTLFRGAQPSDAALEQLAQSGIKTVIDLRLEGMGTDHENAVAKKLGLTYIHIPMSFKTPNDDQINSFMNIATNPKSGPVYVHCRQGADRTGTMCAIYRRATQGWTFAQAYAEMRQHHFKPFLLNMKSVVAHYPVSSVVATVASADTRKHVDVSGELEALVNTKPIKAVEVLAATARTGDLLP